VNSLPKTVTRERRDCGLNPGPSGPESSTLTTRLPRHVSFCVSVALIHRSPRVQRAVETARTCAEFVTATTVTMATVANATRRVSMLRLTTTPVECTKNHTHSSWHSSSLPCL